MGVDLRSTAHQLVAYYWAIEETGHTQTQEKKKEHKKRTKEKKTIKYFFF